MAIVNEFDYVKPSSVGDALKMLKKHGAAARVLAGGTDLISLMADDVVVPQLVVDIKGLAGLGTVRFAGGKLSIGALATFTDIAASPAVRRSFPVIREMTGWVASRGIRNRATLVGNICSAVPCCDSGPILLVYDGVVVVRGARGARRVPIAKWFTGPRRTAIRPGELVTGVELKLPKKKHAGAFVKLRRYKGEDLAQASVTVVALAGNEYRIAFGSVAPTPVSGTAIEAFLKGKPLTDDVVRTAADRVPEVISPITDIRSTKEYRLHMCKVMLGRGLKAAASRLAGKGPDYGVELI